MSQPRAQESRPGERLVSSDEDAHSPGDLLDGTYELLDRIGSGGMAEVYAAEHTRLGRHFAVKIVRSDRGPKAVERFRREARAIARIQNDFVVEVVDCGETQSGTPYLVMELLAGEDLRSLIARAAPLPIPRAVSLIWEACQGVAAVHAAGLVHRDLKPENLYVTRRSTGEDWCKVLDFGIAKSHVSCSTAHGSVIGTVGYMAPEQLHDGASAGPSADVYALGCVLYECLGGIPPHSGTTTQELMFKVMNQEPKRLEGLRDGVPAGLADAVHRALAKSPDSRFIDVSAFGRAIAPYRRADTADAVVSDTTTVEFEPQVRVSPKSRSQLVMFAVVALACASMLAVLLAKRHSGPASSASAASSQVVAASRPIALLPVDVEARPTSPSSLVQPSTAPRAPSVRTNRPQRSNPRVSEASARLEDASRLPDLAPTVAPSAKPSAAAFAPVLVAAPAPKASLWRPDNDWLERQK